MAAMTPGERGFRCIPMMTVMGMLFFLSHQPGAPLQFPLPPGSDKIVHGFLYAVLAGTAIFALVSAPPRSMLQAGLLVVLFCLLYGISDEFHQSFVPGRQPSGGDLLADTAGSAVAVAGWLRHAALRRLKTV